MLNENNIRGHSRFVFKIPDNMTNEDAATFFCAGVTTYSPFRRYGVNAFSKVGVIGIGEYLYFLNSKSYILLN
jgi:D-arabinose 1-dehydrogenase-like Zn-dependent alcohol dehydrogenase